MLSVFQNTLANDQLADDHLESGESSSSCDSKTTPAVATTKISPRRPLLSEIVNMICEDAKKDSLKYALRSNVGHDGE